MLRVPVEVRIATESTPMDNATLVLRLAERCRDAQQWTKADRLFAAAAASDSTPATLARCGAYFAERQDHHAAIVHLMHGLDGAQAAGDLDLQGVLFGNLAAVYRELGEQDLAQRFQRQVLAIHGAADAGDMLDWGSDALLAGKVSLAEKLVDNALDLVEGAADISTQADAWGLLGVIAARQAKLRLAVRLLIRAARGHQIDGDDRGLGVDFQNLAEVFGLMDRWEWQRMSFQAAETCFTRAGMPVSTLRVQRRLRDSNRLALYRRMDAAAN